MQNPWIWICRFNASAIFHLPWCWCSCHNENERLFYLERYFEVCVTNSDPLIADSWIVRNSVSNLPNLAWVDKAHWHLVPTPIDSIEIMDFPDLRWAYSVIPWYIAIDHIPLLLTQWEDSLDLQLRCLHVCRVHGEQLCQVCKTFIQWDSCCGTNVLMHNLHSGSVPCNLTLPTFITLWEPFSLFEYAVVNVEGLLFFVCIV